MVDVREDVFRVRMSDRERAMLAALAESEQLTQSEYIRHLVRREYAQLPKQEQKRGKRA